MLRQMGRSIIRAVIGASVALALPVASGASVDPHVGQRAPALVVKDLNGAKFDLAADNGRVVVVTFWASWCLPCRQEMPVLDAFYLRRHNDGVDIIAMSIDSRRERSSVRKAMEPFTYPCGLLADSTINGFSAPHVLPVTYVIDPNGIVVAVFRGGTVPMTDQSLAMPIIPLLTHRNDSAPKR
ncbi:MAG: TlpA disulfide reductase family protein [Capsulimonadaceae bacterium]|nr:TlpA disulfide reductase family protein [Capsulimonadaceae bacterium]